MTNQENSTRVQRYVSWKSYDVPDIYDGYLSSRGHFIFDLYVVTKNYQRGMIKYKVSLRIGVILIKLSRHFLEPRYNEIVKKLTINIKMEEVTRSK